MQPSSPNPLGQQTGHRGWARGQKRHRDTWAAGGLGQSQVSGRSNVPPGKGTRLRCGNREGPGLGWPIKAYVDSASNVQRQDSLINRILKTPGDPSLAGAEGGVRSPSACPMPTRISGPQAPSVGSMPIPEAATLWLRSPRCLPPWGPPRPRARAGAQGQPQPRALPARLPPRPLGLGSHPAHFSHL